MKQECQKNVEREQHDQNAEGQIASLKRSNAGLKGALKTRNEQLAQLAAENERLNQRIHDLEVDANAFKANYEAYKEAYETEKNKSIWSKIFG